MSKFRSGILILGVVAFLVGLVWIGMVIGDLIDHPSGDYGALAIPLFILTIGGLTIAYTIPHKH